MDPTELLDSEYVCASFVFMSLTFLLPVAFQGDASGLPLCYATLGLFDLSLLVSCGQYLESVKNIFTQIDTDRSL